jgi:hypothetical protein
MERAAFILCDELVEVTCREKIKQTVRNLGIINFYNLMTHPRVGFDVTIPGIGMSAFECQRTRNDMQHNNPAATSTASIAPTQSSMQLRSLSTVSREQRQLFQISTK